MPTFPVDINAHFHDVGMLKTNLRAFDLSDPRSYNETKGGQSIITGYGTPLWYGMVSVVPLHHALQRPLEARARMLQHPAARFFIGDLMEDWLPAYGSPTIGSIGWASNTISLNGLTANYQLKTGTRIAWSFGTGRRTLHEIQLDRTANASGAVAGVELWPPIPVGSTTTTPVVLGGAAKCIAAMVPGSLSAGRADGSMTEGFTFEWRQDLR